MIGAMKTKQPRNALLFALCLTAAALAGLACLTTPPAPQPPLSHVAPMPTEDRSNCGEIYGTAFRSEAERAWFIANCSSWPLVRVADAPPGPPPGAPVNGQQQPNRSGQALSPVAPGDRGSCDEIRGTAYRSTTERTWYLANCGGQPSTPVQVPGSAQLQAGAPPLPGDRTSCNEIRGTAYRSASERNWYLANCAGQVGAAAGGAAPPPQAGGGPDRTNCDEIRGTAYRSDQERGWFLTNCR
jgi:hypothetical protein